MRRRFWLAICASAALLPCLAGCHGSLGSSQDPMDEISSANADRRTIDTEGTGLIALKAALAHGLAAPFAEAAEMISAAGTRIALLTSEPLATASTTGSWSSRWWPSTPHSCSSLRRRSPRAVGAHAARIARRRLAGGSSRSGRSGAHDHRVQQRARVPRSTCRHRQSIRTGRASPVARRCLPGGLPRRSCCCL